MILTDSKWGRHEQFTIQGNRHTWTVISRGKVSVALNDKWRQSWQVGAIPASTDGKGAECRVMLLQLPCYKRMGIAVMAVYAPSSTGSVDDLSEHLEDLAKVAGQRRSRLVVGGDFNAEVGSRQGDRDQAVGPHGVGRRNERGRKLVQVCEEMGWSVTNTWTNQRQKTTWKHPRYKSEHLLDYIMVERRHLRNVLRVLTLHRDLADEYGIPDWEEYTDHKPVEMRIKLAPPKGHRAQQVVAERPALYKGRGTGEQARRLRQRYAEQLAELRQAAGPGADWRGIQEMTKQAALEVFGRTESRPRRPWFRGREHELLEMNHEVTTKQRRADELHAAGARPEASPQEVALWQGAKRDLAASRRHKRRRLITWENEYWTQVGEQAERAEHRGDHYTLYSVMEQLRARGARAANMGEKEISGTRSRRPRRGDSTSSRFKTGRSP